MLFGLALMAVPLLAAVLTAVLQIRDLSDTGQKIVIQGVTGARASQALFGQIASLERTARLHQVLKDPKLLEVYRTQDQRLSTTREQLHTLATGDARAGYALNDDLLAGIGQVTDLQDGGQDGGEQRHRHQRQSEEHQSAQ